MDDPAKPAPVAQPADPQPLSAFSAQPEQEDAQLLLGLEARDEAALAALYDRYSAAVYALLLRLLDHTTAQEVLQDVFLRLWQAPGRFDPARAELRSYLLVMARSRALDRLRQAKNEWRLYDDQGDDFPLPDERQNPFSQAVRAERSELLTRALGSLSEAQRETVRRTFLLGESREETARGMGVPLGTVKSRLNSALGRLRELLAGRLESRPDVHSDGAGDAGIQRGKAGSSNE